MSSVSDNQENELYKLKKLLQQDHGSSTFIRNINTGLTGSTKVCLWLYVAGVVIIVINAVCRIMEWPGCFVKEKICENSFATLAMLFPGAFLIILGFVIFLGSLLLIKVLNIDTRDIAEILTLYAKNKNQN